MIRVTLLERVVLAMSVVLPVVRRAEPYCMIGYQIQPQSGSMVMVETTSNQKKKLLKYPSIAIPARMISKQYAVKENRVRPKKTLSALLGSATMRMSSKNKE